MYQPASQGRKISLCGLILISGVEHFNLIDGAYNHTNFCEFLTECYDNGAFENNPVLILDNVRFHHCEQVLTLLSSYDVEVVFLPPYSPDLNPIENVFSCIKGRLNRIRPRATTPLILKENISLVVYGLEDFQEYYRHFWYKVNEILNRLSK